MIILARKLWIGIKINQVLSPTLSFYQEGQLIALPRNFSISSIFQISIIKSIKLYLKILIKSTILCTLGQPGGQLLAL